MKNNQKISWKTIPIETTSKDGILLKGELHYWAKDYTVCLKEPFEAQGGGGHMMYAVPAIYVTTETVKEGIIHINILDKAKDGLRCLYRRGYSGKETVSYTKNKKQT
jgi:hypothetical protein